MTHKMQTNQEINLYIPSVLGLLLILMAVGIIWVGQGNLLAAEQSLAKPAVEKPAAGLTQAQPEPAPAQAAKSDPTAGQTLFTGTCSACHGPAAEGISGLGKSLVISEFVAGQTDDQLISFIKVGRGPTDPLNTTGVAMPPKGGNPALSDQDLQNIVAFLRSLHK